jgi:hypothetical protein
MSRKTIEHPSFGHVTIGRQSSNRDRLFGAAGSNHNCISIEISDATVDVDEAEGSYFINARKRILEIAMTPLQFAEAIASLNCSEGSPCTITWRDGKFLSAPDEPPTTRLEHVEKQFQHEMIELGKECDEFLATARALREKANVNKGDREQFVKLAEGLVNKITATTPYLMKRFTECVEDLMCEIKVDSSAKPPGS